MVKQKEIIVSSVFDDGGNIFIKWGFPADSRVASGFDNHRELVVKILDELNNALAQAVAEDDISQLEGLLGRMPTRSDDTDPPSHP